MQMAEVQVQHDRLTGTERDNLYFHNGIYVLQVQMQLITADDALKLTVKSSPCLLYTPVFSSASTICLFRHCSHSNIVFSASIQSSQNNKGYRR